MESCSARLWGSESKKKYKNVFGLLHQHTPSLTILNQSDHLPKSFLFLTSIICHTTVVLLLLHLLNGRYSQILLFPKPSGCPSKYLSLPLYWLCSQSRHNLSINKERAHTIRSRWAGVETVVRGIRVRYHFIIRDLGQSRKMLLRALGLVLQHAHRSWENATRIVNACLGTRSTKTVIANVICIQGDWHSHRVCASLSAREPTKHVFSIAVRSWAGHASMPQWRLRLAEGLKALVVSIHAAVLTGWKLRAEQGPTRPTTLFPGRTVVPLGRI